MKRNTFAIIQLGLGLISTVIVLVSFLVYRQPLQNATQRLDMMSQQLQSEMSTMLDVLDEVDHVASAVQSALPSHQQTLRAFESSVNQSQQTLLVWQEQIPGIQAIAHDTSNVFRSFAAQLPIRVPMVQTEMRKVNFELPEVSIKTREGAIPIPTAEVRMKKYQFEMPDNVEITQREFLKDEKALLEKSAIQLASLQAALGSTAESIELVRAKLLQEVVGSVEETRRGMDQLGSALEDFRSQAIPSARADLKSQVVGIEESRGVFSTLRALIPIFFSIAGLTTTAITVSAAAKLFGARIDHFRN